MSKKELRKSLSDSLKSAGVKAQVRTAGRLLKIIADEEQHSPICDVVNRDGRFGSVFKKDLGPQHFESDGKTLFAYPR